MHTLHRSRISSSLHRIPQKPSEPSKACAAWFTHWASVHLSFLADSLWQSIITIVLSIIKATSITIRPWPRAEQSSHHQQYVASSLTSHIYSPSSFTSLQPGQPRDRPRLSEFSHSRSPNAHLMETAGELASQNRWKTWRKCTVHK